MTVCYQSHNPYFSRWFSAIEEQYLLSQDAQVTILILVDGFLQYLSFIIINKMTMSHNPYFSRWFSAI